MPNFETFHRPTPAPADVPTLTIGSAGTIHLNKAAVEALGSPRAVELLCDMTAEIIGLRPSDSENAFSLSRTRDGGGAQVNARSFLSYYGVGGDYTLATFRYPAHLDGGILCADLSRQGTPTTSNRRTAHML